MKPKKHWDFKSFVCTGRHWQRPNMQFVRQKKQVTCLVCLGLLKIHKGK